MPFHKPRIYPNIKFSLDVSILFDNPTCESMACWSCCSCKADPSNTGSTAKRRSRSCWRLGCARLIFLDFFAPSLQDDVQFRHVLGFFKTKVWKVAIWISRWKKNARNTTYKFSCPPYFKKKLSWGCLESWTGGQPNYKMVTWCRLQLGPPSCKTPSIKLCGNWPLKSSNLHKVRKTGSSHK